MDLDPVGSNTAPGLSKFLTTAKVKNYRFTVFYCIQVLHLIRHLHSTQREKHLHFYVLRAEQFKFMFLQDFSLDSM